MGLFDGLYIFVQVKDRPSRDVGRDIRTIQQHGGSATVNADNPRITHCIVSLPSPKPQPYFIRTFDEPPHSPPKDCHQWTCDHLLYYFTYQVGKRNPRVVQSEWLYESISARRRLGPNESWGGWRIQCEMGRPSSRPFTGRERLPSNPSVKSTYAGPVRDISKDPRLKGKQLKSANDTQDDDRRRPSPAKSESSEEDEPLRNRQSLKKRVIHSFTPSPHQTPRPSPPKSPVGLSVKASPKSPQSPTSLESRDLKGSTSLNGPAPAHKPAVPPITVSIPSAQNQSVQTAPSSCYVPRSAQSSAPSGQQEATATATANGGKASTDGKGPAPWSRLTTSSPPPGPTSLRASGPATMITTTATAAAAPAPSTSKAAPAPAAVLKASSVSGGEPVVSQAALIVSTTASNRSSASLTPLPSPVLSSTSMTYKSSAVPVGQAQPAPVAVSQPSPAPAAPPANTLPTPVTPATTVPPSAPIAAAAAQAAPRPPERAEPGLLAPRDPPMPLRMFLSEGLKRGTRNIVALGKASEVPLCDADYVIVSSDATKRSLPGPVPQWAVVVDEAWLHDSFLNDELQNVREYFVDPPASVPSAQPSPVALVASISPSAPSRKRKSATLPSAEIESPKATKSRAPKRPAPAPEPEPEEDMVIDVDDSDDESYIGSGDEADDGDGDGTDGDRDRAASAPLREPTDADISNVYWLVDELLKWDKRGPIRHQLERCSRDVGIPNARKLYYTYKEYIKKNVPDLRARRPYKKRARVQ